MPAPLLWIGFAALAVLPGAWLAGSVLGRESGFFDRLAGALACSPPVLVLEFHLARWSGLAPQTATTVLVFANLPALVLLVRRRPTAPALQEQRRTLAASLLAFLPAAALIAGPWLALPDHAFWSHTLMHVDAIRQIADGALVPEEANLAGVRLGYPWLIHVHQAVVGLWLGQPPSSAFVFTNLLLLFAALHAVASTVRALGGGFGGRLAATWFLAFALNAVGFALSRLLPSDLVASWAVFGDWRYTPWLWTFRFLCPMPYALALVTLLVERAVRALRTGRLARGEVLGTSLLVLAIGMLYAILLPVVALFLCAALLGQGFVRRDRRLPPRAVSTLALGCAAAALLAWLFLAFVTKDRGPAAVELTLPRRAAAKAVEIALVTLPFALFLPRLLASLRRDRRPELAFLAAAIPVGLASYVLLHLPFHANEYKFVYATAPLLALPVGLAGARAVADGPRWSRWALTVFALACPLVPLRKLDETWPARPSDRVRADGRHLALAADDPLHRVVTALRTSTPPETVVLADRAALYVPAFAERSLYAPLQESRPFPGINLAMSYLLRDVKAYPDELVGERERTRDALFAESSAREARERALATVRALQRPVAILVDRERHGALAHWLAERPDARVVLVDPPFELVVLDGVER